MTVADTRSTVEAVWRIESPRLIAGLARMARGDVGLAEELAQDALVAALEQWPESGVPRNPGAWLMTTAKRRAVDQFRRNERYAEKLVEVGRDQQVGEGVLPDFDAALDDHIEDDLLRLLFVACHPVLNTQARVALTLRMLGGLTTDEIARAFLVRESTIAQRIVRAKKALAAAKVPFEVPEGDERVARVSSVLEVLYLVFNEGYSATRGDDWMRPALCEEAMRLGRVLAGLMPGESEVHGLVALMELQSSRSKARTGPAGEPVLLLDQDRARWDRLLIQHGLAALTLSEQIAEGAYGPYSAQAAIAACHARARKADETDWARIAALYEGLGKLQPSPVVELNRGVAVAMAYGPEAGLAVVDAVADEPALKDYHLLPSVRGDLLRKLGRLEEAEQEFRRAAEMTENARERALLLSRATAVGR
ncbi:MULTISPECIES: RNA polymerase sigma factor [unclassified Amycolatopsis]|uniref:RNA polymerase sigma factor n=1 Tax=unclassified Amycolatopsis TaxID=2618356 RepID=UPI001FF2BAE5|nr:MULTISPECIES: RNA polymerase sigma factor [unclassified Amycolatopsis]UOZ08253.1 RNA polymerase sigma factor [Amycolatopsis sp. WQ 127309]WSJ74516.1 RNA polymerase sigma factor [Amycolatopsis sp. NBC_01307]WSK81832.1 RNA polymerase sigma factor [Amycolatopsis sp. NBC_01286]